MKKQIQSLDMQVEQATARLSKAKAQTKELIEGIGEARRNRGKANRRVCEVHAHAHPHTHPHAHAFLGNDHHDGAFRDCRASL